VAGQRDDRGRRVTDTAMNVLLVDDDDVDVVNVQRAFQQAHITSTLHVAGNGIDALAMLRAEAFPRARRLVLLDLNMPRMNGIEFLRAVRADPTLASLPVVVLTTSNAERDKVDAYDLNVAGYLLKPVTHADFVEMMATLHRYWELVELP